MIRTDQELHSAQEGVRRLEQFLVASRRSHATEDYPRMAEPFLLELQERQREIVAYLSEAPAVTMAA